MSRSHRAASWLAVVALVVAGCGSSGSSATSTASASSGGDLATFCAAMKALSGAQLSPAQLDAAHDRIVQSAPDDIAADATEFATNSRAVSDAFLAATQSSVDTAAVLATLTPEQQKFVTDLASASKTGVAPAGSTGRVLTYVDRHC